MNVGSNFLQCKNFYKQLKVHTLYKSFDYKCIIHSTRDDKLWCCNASIAKAFFFSSLHFEMDGGQHALNFITITPP